MADVSVRPAGPGDVAEIARIQLDTWRYGYRDIVASAVLERLSSETAVAAWQQAVQVPPSQRHRVLVALEAHQVVGFTAVAPAEDLLPQDADPEHTAAIGPLLVEPRWGRRGHGSRLMAAAVEFLREDGMTRALTWIPEADLASREFLVGAGWALDGVVRALDTGAGELRETRLHTSLA